MENQKQQFDLEALPPVKIADRDIFINSRKGKAKQHVKLIAGDCLLPLRFRNKSKRTKLRHCQEPQCRARFCERRLCYVYCLR